MDIVVKYLYRPYIFHSKNDAKFAKSFWIVASPDLEKFEKLLDEYNIEFEYDL